MDDKPFPYQEEAPPPETQPLGAAPLKAPPSEAPSFEAASLGAVPPTTQAQPTESAAGSTEAATASTDIDHDAILKDKDDEKNENAAIRPLQPAYVTVGNSGNSPSREPAVDLTATDDGVST